MFLSKNSCRVARDSTGGFSRQYKNCALFCRGTEQSSRSSRNSMKIFEKKTLNIAANKFYMEGNKM